MSNISTADFLKAESSVVDLITLMGRLGILNRFRWNEEWDTPASIRYAMAPYIKSIISKAYDK